MTNQLFIAAAVAAVSTLLLTPLASKLAYAVGAVDYPGDRKVHHHPTPRLGGVALAASLLFTFPILDILFPGTGLLAAGREGSGPFLLVASFLILSLGVCDDIRPLRPVTKFLVQSFAATVVYVAGVRFDSFTDPVSGWSFALGSLSYPLTMVWLVGVTNAFNLIDGLDGLAAGIGAIAAVTISAGANMQGETSTAIVAATLAGGACGFLRHNFNPAKIFLGDSGSLFLGFALAVLSIEGSSSKSPAASIVAPLLAIGVPIVDTALAMMRRIFRCWISAGSRSRSVLTKLSAIVLPDRRHVHHQLMACGFSHRDAVIVLYGVSLVFGVCALLVSTGILNAAPTLAAVGTASVLAVSKLGYTEFSLLRNGFLLQLYRRTLLGRGVGQYSLEVTAVVFAAFLAYLLSAKTDKDPAAWGAVVASVTVVSAVQLAAFFFGGAYRRQTPLLGIGEVLQTVRCALLGAATASFALLCLPWGEAGTDLWVFALLDFYFLVTAIIGSRGAFQVLYYLYSRGRQEPRFIDRVSLSRKTEKLDFPPSGSALQASLHSPQLIIKRLPAEAQEMRGS